MRYLALLLCMISLLSFSACGGNGSNLNPFQRGEENGDSQRGGGEHGGDNDDEGGKED